MTIIKCLQQSTWINDIETIVSDPIVCLDCGKEHLPDSETFITFYGNVTVGLKGGIIGNNLDSDRKVLRCHHICNNSKCWVALVKRMMV